MKKEAKKGDWVRIKKVILAPEDRFEHLPEATKKVPLLCWMNGFLDDECAQLGDEVAVFTYANRVVRGELVSVNPAYEHGFGVPQQALQHVGIDLRYILGAEAYEQAD